MLRGALLGAGNIAQNGHLPSYLSDPCVSTSCRIVAAADLSQENLARIVRLVPGIATYRSAAELLACERPDFVDICAPPYAHRELIEHAAGYGCHILCEKPLSLTLADAVALSDCLQAAPIVFLPGHQYHYAPIWQAVTAAIRGGEIGTLRYGVISIQRQRANDGNPHWQPTWRTCEALSGGGILMDHGTHLFYQLRAICGRPRRIAAQVDTRLHIGYGVEDTASCYIEYEQALVRLNLTWAAPTRRTVHRYFGDAGILACDETGIRISRPTGCNSRGFATGFSSGSSHADWYAPLLRDFLSRIKRGDFDREPLAEAVDAIRCATAAYDSARLGLTVDLDM